MRHPGPKVCRPMGPGPRAGEEAVPARTDNPSKVDRVPGRLEIELTVASPASRPAVAPTSSAEGTMKAGAARGDMPTTPRAGGSCNGLTTSLLPLGEQVGCDHRARARLRRTPRFVQDIAALVRFKFLQLSCSHDRACDIKFTEHWANNGHAGDCRPDLFCNSTADGAVHVLARWLRRPLPLPRRDQPTTGRGLLLHAVRHLHPDGGG